MKNSPEDSDSTKLIKIEYKDLPPSVKGLYFAANWVIFVRLLEQAENQKRKKNCFSFFFLEFSGVIFLFPYLFACIVNIFFF